MTPSAPLCIWVPYHQRILDPQAVLHFCILGQPPGKHHSRLSSYLQKVRLIYLDVKMEKSTAVRLLLLLVPLLPGAASSSDTPESDESPVWILASITSSLFMFVQCLVGQQKITHKNWLIQSTKIHKATAERVTNAASWPPSSQT